MKRRRSMFLLGGFFAAGCGGRKAEVAGEETWIGMRDHWEAMGGGQVDVGSHSG